MRVLKVVFSLIAVFFSASLLATATYDSCPNLSGGYRCENRHGIEHNVNITQRYGRYGTTYTLSYEIKSRGIVETVSMITDGIARESGGRRVSARCLRGVLVKGFRNPNPGEVSYGVYFMDDNDNLRVLLGIFGGDDGYHTYIEGSCSRI